MIFTLEALRAKKGDALLLHVGPANEPRLFVVDGGPAGTYRQFLGPRLDALRRARGGDRALRIDLVMVSHIDADHIQGILDLTNQLRDEHERNRELSYRIRTLWHNSFDDLLGPRAAEVAAHGDAVAGASRGMAMADMSDEELEELVLDPHTALMLASVPQGRDLRDNASLLGLGLNQGDGSAILCSPDPVTPPLAPDLETLVIGPSALRRDELQVEWDKELVKRGLVEVADYADRSAYNLASIVVLLRAGGRSMLLTGDARGDDVLEGLEATGAVSPGGSIHVDLLKLPHHGSDNNVEVDFFRRITADHYVLSGDGSHGNPAPATLGMLFEARAAVRPQDPFTLYLTYPPEEFRPHRGEPYPLAELKQTLAAAEDAGRRFQVITPAEAEPSVVIDLLEPYDGR